MQEQLSPIGRLQVNIASSVMQALVKHLDRLRRRMVAIAQHVAGAPMLTDAIYGVGPMTSLALVAWLGGANRFSASHKAVRLVGLDITVHSSNSKRSPAGRRGRDQRYCAGCCSRRPRPPRGTGRQPMPRPGQPGAAGAP